ncbi:PTS ascorbate transporter subunit IIC [Candidatus Xianfuyuplasma coldseepsis]|uniref:Ascorbate-specific PTS system EIIC component n=1 Tax=Candidatus Xianfuyuplasma coldseepsis TaxID=2782163 RepID=A0A7L7KRB5_9MOLU|nr:PTS ascorbate transporter subunit IIC [Xianfuyuplasma coldseepsis]QMS85125.1 PTS ascorbate transporter subunit IIC [Xianfuyuplasma coldseepsis]
MSSVISFISELLSSPQILLGLIVLVGLAAQRKPFNEVVRGTLKAILGFVIIGAGAGILVGSLDYFGQLFQEAFSLTGVVPNNEAIVATALEDYATYTAGIMIIGMAANILIARFSRLKYIFLTGHHTLFMAALIAVVLKVAGLEGVLLYVLGGMALGLTMVLFPALGQRYMKEVTGSEDIALGHFSTATYFLSGLSGKLFGKGSKSTEEMNFPQSLSFLRDSSVAIALTMLIMYVITTLFAGPQFVADELGVTDNYLVFAFIQSLTFAAGVYIVLQGVRMVISEIVPAFKGWSDKIVPDAKPALDCPIVFPYAPNAVLIGFVVSFIGGIIGMGILILVGGIVILPGIIPHFFLGATAGVFGNATGGRRGAVIGSFVNGIAISFLPLLLLPILGDLGFENTTFGDADFVVVGSILGLFAGWGKWVLAALIGVLFAIPFVDAVLNKEKTV